MAPEARTTTEEDRGLVQMLDAVLVDPNLHTDLRLRLHQDLTQMLSDYGEEMRARGRPAGEAPPARVAGQDGVAALSEIRTLDAMRPGVITCEPGDGLPRLAGLLVDNGIHMLALAPVDAQRSRVISALEVVAAAIQSPLATAAALAREPAVTVSAEATLERAVSLMASRFVRHLLVIDPTSRAPIGTVSSFDVAAVIAGMRPRMARMLRPGPARPMISARALSEARAGDAMHPGIATCPADASLGEVARALAEHRVHCVAVTGIEPRTHRLTWGLLGDLDLVLSLHQGPTAEPAGALARTQPVAVTREDSLELAARLMIEHQTTHVVVVDGAGLPTGMLSSIDVARVIAASA